LERPEYKRLVEIVGYEVDETRISTF